MANRGSIPTGPSDQYLKLLKGEMAPEEYVKSVQKRVEDQSRGKPPSSPPATGGQAKRAR